MISGRRRMEQIGYTYKQETLVQNHHRADSNSLWSVLTHLMTLLREIKSEAQLAQRKTLERMSRLAEEVVAVSRQ